MPKIAGISPQALLLEKIRELRLQNIPSNIVKIRKNALNRKSSLVDDSTEISIEGLSHSILIAGGEWFILPHRGQRVDEDTYSGLDWIAKGAEHEVRRVYKIDFPENANDLPSISDKYYLVKEATNEHNLSLSTYCLNIKRKTDAIREHEDQNAKEVWRNPKAQIAPTKPTVQAKHYVILEGFKGLNLKEYAEYKTRKDYKKRGLPIPQGIDLAVSIIDEITKVHAQNKIHGDLSQQNVLYDEQTKEVHLIDFSLSVPFDEPIRGHGYGLLASEHSEQYKKSANYENIRANPKQDVYALGARSDSPLTYPFMYNYDNNDQKETEFRGWLKRFYRDQFVGAIIPERRATLEEARTVLSNLKIVYENDVEYQRFQQITEAFDTIKQKIDSLETEKESLTNKALDEAWLLLNRERIINTVNNSKEALLIDGKIKALTNVQEIIASQFMRCYMHKPGTSDHQEALNQFCQDLQQRDWRKEASTADVHTSRSHKGLIADIGIGVLGGFIVMIIKGIIASIQGKSFVDNLRLFSKPDAVSMMEKLVHEDLPAAVCTRQGLQ